MVTIPVPNQVKKEHQHDYASILRNACDDLDFACDARAERHFLAAYLEAGEQGWMAVRNRFIDLMQG